MAFKKGKAYYPLYGTRYFIFFFVAGRPIGRHTLDPFLNEPLSRDGFVSVEKREREYCCALFLLYVYEEKKRTVNDVWFPHSSNRTKTPKFDWR